MPSPARGTAGCRHSTVQRQPAHTYQQLEDQPAVQTSGDRSVTLAGAGAYRIVSPMTGYVSAAVQLARNQPHHAADGRGACNRLVGGR